MTNYILLQYQDICAEPAYPYLEHEEIEDVDCMRLIQKILKDILYRFQKKLNLHVYNCKNLEEVHIEDILQKQLLFYSVENGIKGENFLFCVNDLRGIQENCDKRSLKKGEFIFGNDWDGLGVIFEFDDKETQNEITKAFAHYHWRSVSAWNT